MAITVKGLYSRGIIKPLENVNIKGKAEVLITFLDTARKKEKIHFASSAGSWRDMDTEKLKKQIYESRGISTRREVKL
jgi:predicted DNA-binding antitoxin AbrB/MazE fold protein